MSSDPQEFSEHAADAGGSGAEGPGVIERAAVLREVMLLYLGTLLAIKAVVALQSSFNLPADVLVAVPLLFLYVPVFWLRRRQLEPGDFGLTLTWEAVGPALRLDARVIGVILPFFLLGNHLYQTLIFHRSPVGLLPKDYLSQVVLYHLLFVGPPEEFFYRGYMQSRLNQVFPRRYRVFGASFGWALPLTALLFTAGHSLVVMRWWHFSIFFPALVFGWMREKSGNILASSLFHAFCNILMVTLETWYGVIKP
jgi:hypothetical protein